MQSEYRYDYLYPDDVKRIRAASPIAYLPLGAMEWHDMHAPLGTDSFIAQGLCLRLARETGGVVLPPHQWSIHGASVRRPYAWEKADGSLSLERPEIWAEEMRAQVAAVFREGWRVIVFMPGHVGQPERDILTKIASEHDLIGEPQVVYVYPYFYTPGDHAGRYETSILLGLNPELVRDEPSVGNPFAREPKSLATREDGERQIQEIVNPALGLIRQAVARAGGGDLGVEEYARKISRKFA